MELSIKLPWKCASWNYNIEALRVGCARCRPHTILTQTVVSIVYCATLSGLLRRRISVIECGLYAYRISSIRLKLVFLPLASKSCELNFEKLNLTQNLQSPFVLFSPVAPDSRLFSILTSLLNILRNGNLAAAENTRFEYKCNTGGRTS